jgi:hypothetical protein
VLDAEIKEARRKIHREMYDMSFGELMSLYGKKELVINPEYQRLFRWEPTQKTRFIESLLLNIPVPPIFVFTMENGTWELVDGLQRVSTVLQFTGKLRYPDGSPWEPFVCEGTRALPSLDGMRWPTEEEEAGDGDERPDVLPPAHRLALQRARIRIEILDHETDPHTKFELFQRLNTGGSKLSEQEVRDCTIFSLNPQFHKWLKDVVTREEFTSVAKVSEAQAGAGFERELVVRFVVYRNVPYKRGTDLHDYLDEGAMALATGGIDFAKEEALLLAALKLCREAAGDVCFTAVANGQFSGKFSRSAFEFATLGLSKHLERGTAFTPEFVRSRLEALWRDDTFNRNRGAGVRGTTRLSNLIFAKAEAFFAP